MRNVMAVDKGKIIGILSAASGVSYDNTDSGLTSTNVQDAIDEVSSELSDKVDKVAGKGLSTNDYTNTDKTIVDGVTSALAGKVDKVTGKGLSTNDYDNTAKGIVDGVTSALAGKVDTSSVGSSNGVAELDANGRVPSSQLPSYVDDVLEYSDLAHFPATGESGKIYIAEDTNKTYRWSGSDYAEISESLALGETSSTAYAGNKGKANADAIAAIKDGTNIDSFGDVETALSGKANSSDLGDKSNLTTTDKSSCVGAINEVDDKVKDVSNALANYASLDIYISNSGEFPDANTVTKELVYINGFQSGLTNYPSEVSNTAGILLTRWFYYSGDLTVSRMQLVFTLGGLSFCRFTDGSSWTPWQSTGVGILSNLTTTDKSSCVGAINEVNSKLNKTSTTVNIDSTYDAGTDWNILKQGNICVMNMRDLKDIPNGTTKIGTIPVGFRPEFGFFEYVYSANKDVHLGFKFEDNGDITCLNQTGAAISGTVYANRNVTYFTA